MTYDVAITSCKEYSLEEASRALVRVLEPVGGLLWVKKGMKIAIKPNLVMFKPPDAAATTHPVLIAELCKLLLERGAQVVIGDSPGGPYTRPYLSTVYNITGMGALEKLGGTVTLNRNVAVGEADFSDAKVLKHFQYTKYLDDADAIINFCKLKTHGMMAFSCACKNLFGTIPGTHKPGYHYLHPDYADFVNLLVDLAQYFKPRLNIVDAVYGMEGNGPTAGTPRYVGALLASKDAHALDLACAHIIGLPFQDAPTLVAAHERGLVPKTIEELSVSGNLASFVVKDYQSVATRKITSISGSSSLANRIFDSVFGQRPVLGKAAACIGCAECVRICPADAITMVKNRPAINRKKCIRCFCCQEFCPKGALTVQRTLVARILR